MKNTTAIVILNYKNYQDTINCINSILNSNSRDYFIIVVDNASNNGSLHEIEKQLAPATKVQLWAGQPDFSEGVLLVENKNNSGYAAGNNVGLRIGFQLGAARLMVLNNDTLFTDDALDKLQTVLTGSDDIICTGPLLLKGDGSIDYNCAKRRPQPLDFFRFSYFGKWLKTEEWRKEYYYMLKYPTLSKETDVDIISGSCMLFDARKFHEIGFFDEHTFLYYEEAIIHEKARKKGWKMVLVPQAKVVHLGAQSTTGHSTSLFMLNCEYNSLKYYLRSHRGFSSVMVSLLSSGSWWFINMYTAKRKLKF